jgi:hypothetical protein
MEEKMVTKKNEVDSELKAGSDLKEKEAVLKAGYKTTEFWMSAAAAVAGLLIASGIVAEGSTTMQVIGLIASMLTAMGYTVVRGKAKSETGILSNNT